VTQYLGAMLQQDLLMRRNGVKANGEHIAYRRVQADDAGNVRGPRFETLRHVGIGAALEADGMDHVAAALPGWHVFEYVVADIQGAYPGGTVKLMSRKSVEIAIYFLHVDRLVCDSLSPVYQHLGAD